MKIVAVCGMGMGSSLIAKMNIESILNEKGIEGTVENCDVGSVSGHPADWYVATQEIANNMPEEFKKRTIILHDFVNKDEMEKELSKYLF